MSSGYSRLSVLRALACSVLFVGCTGTVPDQNQTKRETGNDEPSQVPGGKSSGSVTQGNPGTIEGSVVREGRKNTIPAFDAALVNDATLVADFKEPSEQDLALLKKLADRGLLIATAPIMNEADAARSWQQ